MAISKASSSDVDPTTLKPSTMSTAAPVAPLAHPTPLTDLLQALPRLSLPSEHRSLPTFTIFRKLPAQMRNRIWRIAAFEPRIIKLIPYNLAVSQRIEGQLQHPAILHTSRESRREGLRYYQKCLQKCCDIRTHSQTIRCGKPYNIIYVNYESDSFRLGIHGRYVANDGKPAFDWKIIPWGGFNLRMRDMRPIKRLEVELYSSKYPNATDTFRALKPLRDNLKLAECTIFLKRWNGPQELKTAFCEDSFRMAIYHRNSSTAFEQVFKEEQQRKDLQFAVNLKFRTKMEWYDLSPCAPVLPVTSKTASKATREGRRKRLEQM